MAEERNPKQNKNEDPEYIKPRRIIFPLPSFPTVYEIINEEAPLKIYLDALEIEMLLSDGTKDTKYIKKTRTLFEAKIRERVRLGTFTDANRVQSTTEILEEIKKEIEAEIDQEEAQGAPAFDDDEE